MCKFDNLLGFFILLMMLGAVFLALTPEASAKSIIEDSGGHPKFAAFESAEYHDNLCREWRQELEKDRSRRTYDARETTVLFAIIRWEIDLIKKNC